MTRYFLKIGGIEVKKVNALDFEKVYRLNARTATIGGNYKIDRSAQKYSLSVNIGLISEFEFKNIEDVFKNISFPVEFYDGNSLKTISVNIDKYSKPSPLYLYGERERGIYYKDVALTFEEV